MPAPPAPADPAHEHRWRAEAKRSRPIAGTPGERYLAGRGIPIDLARAAHVRFTASWYGRPSVLFPIYAPGCRLVACQGRYIDGRDSPKTRTGGRVSQGVFATPGAWEAPQVVISEAPIDALSLAAAGRPAIALCGKDLRASIVDACALRRARVALDADPAGEQAAALWVAELSRFGADARVWRPEGGKDWNEFLLRDGAAALAQFIQDIEDPFADPPAIFAAGDPAGSATWEGE
jgi:hypothetical protein